MEFSQADIVKLLEFIEQGNVEFLDLKYGELHIVVDRTLGATRIQAPRISTAEAAEPSPVVTPVATRIAESTTVAEPVEVAPVVSGVRGVPVLAPMVGVFYRAPEPGAAPYVEIGDHVESDQQVGIIEVMKVFTAVSAGVSGIVTDILVGNESFVEFNSELMLIAPDVSS
jgi:acetyl-CoA carboxylase biotin carboxyl carrier protein